MSEVKKRCKYESTYTGWKCPYEALEDSKDGFCIFHERRNEKDIKKFNEGIKKILEDKDSDAYHFEGFFFPDSISFEGFLFKKSVFFCQAKFSGKNTNFSVAEFAGKKTDFSGARFSGEFINFIESEFLGKETDFGGAVFTGEDTAFTLAKFLAEETCFFETKFSGENISFVEAQFSGKKTDFFNAKFSGKETDFNDAKFSGENTYFKRAMFSGENTTFIGAQFSGEEVNFDYSKFLKKILFQGTIFEAKTTFTGVDLSKCVFTGIELKNVDFSLLEWDWNHKLGNETDIPKDLKHESYFEASEIYRQLKVLFHNKRDFAKAGMFHFREQECKRKACRLPRDFFKWIFLWILRLSCGYGEKLRNVGLTSVALVLTFAGTYMLLGLYDANGDIISRNFWSSLIFSIKGFFPLWRFQQYRVVGDLANLVAGVEFLLGAFMIGLFIYVFRRRMEK